MRSLVASIEEMKQHATGKLKFIAAWAAAAVVPHADLLAVGISIDAGSTIGSRIIVNGGATVVDQVAVTGNSATSQVTNGNSSSTTGFSFTNNGNQASMVFTGNTLADVNDNLERAGNNARDNEIFFTLTEAVTFEAFGSATASFTSVNSNFATDFKLGRVPDNPANIVYRELEHSRSGGDFIFTHNLNDANDGNFGNFPTGTSTGVLAPGSYFIGHGTSNIQSFNGALEGQANGSFTILFTSNSVPDVQSSLALACIGLGVVATVARRRVPAAAL